MVNGVVCSESARRKAWAGEVRRISRCRLPGLARRASLEAGELCLSNQLSGPALTDACCVSGGELSGAFEIKSTKWPLAIPKISFWEHFGSSSFTNICKDGLPGPHLQGRDSGHTLCLKDWTTTARCSTIKMEHSGVLPLLSLLPDHSIHDGQVSIRRIRALASKLQAI